MTKVFKVSFYHINAAGSTIIDTSANGKFLTKVYDETADTGTNIKIVDFLKSKSIVNSTAKEQDFLFVKEDKKNRISDLKNIPVCEIETV